MSVRLGVGGRTLRDVGPLVGKLASTEIGMLASLGRRCDAATALGAQAHTAATLISNPHRSRLHSRPRRVEHWRSAAARPITIGPGGTRCSVAACLCCVTKPASRTWAHRPRSIWIGLVDCVTDRVRLCVRSLRSTTDGAGHNAVRAKRKARTNTLHRRLDVGRHVGVGAWRRVCRCVVGAPSDRDWLAAGPSRAGHALACFVRRL